MTPPQFQLKANGLGLGNAAMIGKTNQAMNGFWQAYGNSSNNNSIWTSNQTNNSISSAEKAMERAVKTQKNLAIAGFSLEAFKGLAELAINIRGMVKSNKNNETSKGETSEATPEYESIEASRSELKAATKAANKKGDIAGLQSAVRTAQIEVAANDQKIGLIDTSDKKVKAANSVLTGAKGEKEAADGAVDLAETNLTDAEKSLSSCPKDPADTYEARKQELQKNVDTARATLVEKKGIAKEKKQAVEDAEATLTTEKNELGERIKEKKSLEKANGKLKSDIKEAQAELAKRGAEVKEEKLNIES